MTRTVSPEEEKAWTQADQSAKTILELRQQIAKLQRSLDSRVAGIENYSRRVGELKQQRDVQAEQIAAVLALIPRRNPELIEAGYDIDARVILAALGVES